MSIFHQIKNFIRNGKNSSSSDGRVQERFEAVIRLVKEEKLAKQARVHDKQVSDRYKFLEELGNGAFSNVYKAIDLETQEQVAIKVVHKLELSPHQHGSILKEVQIMRTVQHPNVVNLVNFIETNDHYYLVMELCKGGELFHRIVRLTYFSEDLARHCIVQVAETIRYLHEEKGVVHRDIKPENLLFEPIPFIERRLGRTSISLYPGDEDKEDEGEFIAGVGGGGIGVVKIADFGLSKVIWDQKTRTPCGTIGYTAPEIVKDERYSKSVDMWALGCVLYTLLCGFPPFYDESIALLTEKVACGQYTFLSPWWDPISEQAKDLIRHLLCIDPERRYSIDQFLQHPWIVNKTATPIVEYRRQHQQRSEAPLAEQGPPLSTADYRRDVSASMKHAFDVSYAVRRMTEEEQQEQQNQQQPNLAQRAVQRNRQQTRMNNSAVAHYDTTQRLPETTEGFRRIRNPTFELNMDNSTLLGRRKIEMARVPC